MVSDAAAGEEPLNLFETAIREARRGFLSRIELMRAFADTSFVVPSANDLDGGVGSLTPLVFTYQDVPYVGIFTHPSRAAAHADQAPFLAFLNGRDLLAIARPDAGYLVNPGVPGYTFEVAPAAILAARDLLEGGTP